MIGNPGLSAVLFLHQCVSHRFRERDGGLISQCRSRGVRPRTAGASSRRERSDGALAFVACSSRWASARMTR